jgi:hypothetical protein
LELADLGIPPIALTDQAAPELKVLFKWCLHDKVKALFDSHQYVKNPHAPENITARQQSAILEGINQVVNSHPNTRHSISTNANSRSP